MGEVEEIELAEICEFTDLELKDFWCEHLKNESGSDVMTQFSYNFSSETEECFNDSYGNSSEMSYEER